MDGGMASAIVPSMQQLIFAGINDTGIVRGIELLVIRQIQHCKLGR